jgi:hypothetical protein
MAGPSEEGLAQSLGVRERPDWCHLQLPGGHRIQLSTEGWGVCDTFTKRLGDVPGPEGLLNMQALAR